jgi:hypothetical protein
MMLLNNLITISVLMKKRFYFISSYLKLYSMADEPRRASKGDLKRSDSRTDAGKPDSSKTVCFVILLK